MTGLVLTDDKVLPERDVVLEEYNMRVANSPEARLGEQVTAALYLNHPVWTAGDRLAPGDREAQPRGCARVLPALLHAEQRGGGDRGRRYRRRGQAAGREDLWQGGEAHRDRSAQTAAGAAAGRGPPGHARRFACRAAEPAAQLSRSFLDDGEGGRSPKRSKCSPRCSAAARRAGSTAPWSIDQHLATNAGAWYQGTALDDTRFGVYASPLPGVSLRDARGRARRGDRRRRSRTASAKTSSSAPRRGFIADAVYAQDNQATHGALVRRSADHRRRRSSKWRRGRSASALVTADEVREAARAWLDKTPLGHRLSRQGTACPRRSAREVDLLQEPSAASFAPHPRRGHLVRGRADAGARRRRHHDRTRRQSGRHRGLAGRRSTRCR